MLARTTSDLKCGLESFALYSLIFLTFAIQNSTRVPISLVDHPSVMDCLRMCADAWLTLAHNNKVSRVLDCPANDRNGERIQV